MKDPDCIFCKIAAGDIPSTKVYEDDACLAFMDIGPVAEGHVLLIPKDHHATVGQMPADLAGRMLRNVPAIATAVQQAVNADGLNILQNNGKTAHQEVMHVHFHFIPRRSGDAFHFNWPAGEYPDQRAEELAEKIRSMME
ncbi:MAG: HIT family protein [Phycisphaerae bacterium]